MSTSPSHFKGISVFWLQTTFLIEVKVYGKDKTSSLRELEDLNDEPGMIRQKGENITCPRDRNFGTAYADCLVGEENVGEANIVILHSRSWGNTVGDLVDTLVDYCAREELDPKRTYVWIDILCNNLHRIVKRKSTGKWKAADAFEDTLQRTRMMCKKDVKILACISPWYKPHFLNSVLNIYETYLYMNSSEECDLDVSFAMPPEERTNMIRSAIFNTDGLNQLLDMLAELDIEKIGKVEDDSAESRIILDMIRKGPGIQEVNNWVKDWVQDCIVDEICQESCTKIISEEDIDDLCNRIAPVLIHHGSYKQAYRLLQKSFSIHEKQASDEESEKLASLSHSIGVVLQNMNELDESMTFLKKALIYRKKKGLYNVDTADCYQDIGDVHFALENFDKALEMYQMAKIIEEKVNGVNHTRTALAFHSVGKVLNATRRPDEALVYLQQALAIREEIHGRSHVEIAASYRSIASAFTEKDEHDDALVYYKSALRIYEKIYGSNHAETAACCNDIAMVYTDRKEFFESIPYFEKAVEAYEYALGKSHPHTEVARESYREVKRIVCEV